MTKLYSYTMDRDYGFAPNPFFNFCTLATCKPDIRKKAKIGDWVVGTGGKNTNLPGKLIYAMKVTEKLEFTQYWNNSTFADKKPRFDASLKYGYGDNIYRQSNTNMWLQARSHHSNKGGTCNQSNLKKDTSAPHVLISDDFGYWGNNAIDIPDRFKCFQSPGYENPQSLHAGKIRKRVGYFDDEHRRKGTLNPIARDVVDWIRAELNGRTCVVMGLPANW